MWACPTVQLLKCAIRKPGERGATGGALDADDQVPDCSRKYEPGGGVLQDQAAVAANRHPDIGKCHENGDDHGDRVDYGHDLEPVWNRALQEWCPPIWV